MSDKKIIAITGGIGSGKSVVSRILEKLGYPVYDCDSHAKEIMNKDYDIKRTIQSKVCHDAIDSNGDIDRKAIADVVFSDHSKLEVLNRIVHSAVLNDFLVWASASHSELVFVETAILYQSGLDKIVHEVWEVKAPEDLRIERVCVRNSISPAEVKARINSQNIEVNNPHPNIKIIINDHYHSLLLQIHSSLFLKALS